MARIAGIFGRRSRDTVAGMLARMSHGRRLRTTVVEGRGFTLAVGGGPLADSVPVRAGRWRVISDGSPPALSKLRVVSREPLALAAVREGRELLLSRDFFGVAPLYWAREGTNIFFASEVKGLLGVDGEIREFPCGRVFSSLEGWRALRMGRPAAFAGSAGAMAARLAGALDGVIRGWAEPDVYGSWLSGGLDSSAVAAFAARHTRRLHTFSIGLEGSPDLGCAREVAAHLDSVHHEKRVTVRTLERILPDVILALESFDALLVRSTLTNYLLARLSADHVPEVLSGEGGDELFAGYAYLKRLPPRDLAAEVDALPGRLHNTALQRIDRSAAAAGLRVRLPFLSAAVFDCARRIPLRYKLHRTPGKGPVEKWILRRAAGDLLPRSIRERPKAKFWEGSGLGDRMRHLAERRVTAADFARERRLPDGRELASREELMCYRIFRGFFGEVEPSFVGLTREKGAFA